MTRPRAPAGDRLAFDSPPDGPPSNGAADLDRATARLRAIRRARAARQRRAKFLRILLAVTVSLIACCAAELIVPGLPGHQQTRLALDMARSDVDLIFASHDTLGRDATLQQRLDQFNQEFGSPNGLFMGDDQAFAWRATSTTWGAATAIDAESTLALYPGRLGDASADYLQKSLNAVNSLYWGVQPNGTHCYDPGPSAFNMFANNGGDCYNDDTAWMGIANLVADPSRAAAALAVLKSQWVRNGGGVTWRLDQPQVDVTLHNDPRVIVSNAPPALLAAEIANHDGNISDHNFAGSELSWIRSNLYDRRAGLFYDRINPKGRVIRKIFTYNQGVVAAAEAADGKLRPAVALIEHSLAYFRAHRLYGRPQFDEKFFKYALWVGAIVKQPSLSVGISQALDYAIGVEPKNPPDVVHAAGELGLMALRDLPPAMDIRLLPYLPAQLGPLRTPRIHRQV